MADNTIQQNTGGVERQLAVITNSGQPHPENYFTQTPRTQSFPLAAGSSVVAFRVQLKTVLDFGTQDINSGQVIGSIWLSSGSDETAPFVKLGEADSGILLSSLTNSFSTYEFVFSEPIVTDGRRVHIHLEVTGESFTRGEGAGDHQRNFYTNHAGNDAAYPNGRSWQKDGSWTAISQDMWFEVDWNNPVFKPKNPSPANLETDVELDTVLSWVFDDGFDTFKVYFGLSSGDLEYIGDTTSKTIGMPLALKYSTEYQWRIDVVDGEETTEGDVWTFTTKDAPADAPHTPTPENEAVGLPTTPPVLQWECDGEPDRYDVYLGVGDNLNKIGETTDKFFQLPYAAMPDGLPLNWQVVAIYGEEAASSDVWTFECGNGIYDPEPGDGQTGVSGLLAVLRWKYDSVFRHMVVSITTPGQGTLTSDWLWRILKPEGFGEPGCQLYHYGERISEDGGQTWLNWLFYPQSEYLNGDEVFTWSVTATIEWEGAEYEVSNTFTFQIDVPKPFDPTPEIDQSEVAVTWPLATWLYPPVPAPRFDVVVQGSKQASRLSGFEFGIPKGLLAYGQTVAWRVDGVTSFGRVRGEDWSFKTWPLAQYGEAGDITRRRLVAIADNAIWIEDDGN